MRMHYGPDVTTTPLTHHLYAADVAVQPPACPADLHVPLSPALFPESPILLRQSHDAIPRIPARH